MFRVGTNSPIPLNPLLLGGQVNAPEKPQEPEEKPQPVKTPIVVKSQDGKKAFTFSNVKGACFKGQEEQVARALQNYEDHLELFSQGKSHTTWLFFTKVEEEPLAIRYVSTSSMEKELVEMGYTKDYFEDLKKDKVLGFYTNNKLSPNTLWLVIDSWYKPGTPVDLYTTADHELGHAVDDFAYYDEENEPVNGYLSIKHKAELQKHWEKGYQRIGYEDAKSTAITFNYEFEIIKHGVAPPPIPDVKPLEYQVKKNDKLIIIAKRYNCSVDEILSLNPVIANPNRIKTGQTIKIPQKQPPATAEQKAWMDAQNKIAELERRLTVSFPNSYAATAYQGNTFEVDRVLKEYVAVGFESLGDPATRENFQKIDPNFSDALDKFLHFGKFGLTREQAEKNWVEALKKDWTKSENREEGAPLVIEALQPSVSDSYTVRYGDTLSQICERFGYGKRVKAVAEFNGIKNPDVLPAGTVIRFPIK